MTKSPFAKFTGAVLTTRIGLFSDLAAEEVAGRRDLAPSKTASDPSKVPPLSLDAISSPTELVPAVVSGTHQRGADEAVFAFKTYFSPRSQMKVARVTYSTGIGTGPRATVVPLAKTCAHWLVPFRQAV